MGDPWADEGFGGDDDWEGKESVESDLEDTFDPLELEEDAEEELDGERTTRSDRPLPDVKAGQSLRLLSGHVDTVDMRAARAFAAERDEPFHRFGLPLEDRLDGSVSVVARPAGHARSDCPSPQRLAEEDTLDEPVDDDAAPDHGRAMTPFSSISTLTRSPRFG